MGKFEITKFIKLIILSRITRKLQLNYIVYDIFLTSLDFLYFLHTVLIKIITF